MKVCDRVDGTGLSLFFPPSSSSLVSVCVCCCAGIDCPIENLIGSKKLRVWCDTDPRQQDRRPAGEDRRNGGSEPAGFLFLGGWA